MHHLKNHFVPHAGNDHHPHALRHHGLIGLGTILVTLKAVAVFLAIALPDMTRADEAKITITPTAIIELGNEARASKSLPALVVDERLTKAAQEKAIDMVKKGYFSHTSPNGENALDRIRRTDYPVRYAAENLAVHFTTAEEIRSGWMKSPSHRSVLLDERYEDTGVGVAYGFFENHATTFVVQLFGQKTESLIASTYPTLVTNAQLASMGEPVTDTGVARVLARTFSQQHVDGIVQEIYLYVIAALTGLLLLTFAIRFKAHHAASLPHAMAVIGLACVLMLT